MCNRQFVTADDAERVFRGPGCYQFDCCDELRCVGCVGFFYKVIKDVDYMRSEIQSWQHMYDEKCILHIDLVVPKGVATKFEIGFIYNRGTNAYMCVGRNREHIYFEDINKNIFECDYTPLKGSGYDCEKVRLNGVLNSRQIDVFSAKSLGYFETPTIFSKQ